MTRWLVTGLALWLATFASLAPGQTEAQGGGGARAQSELRTVEVALVNCPDDGVELRLEPVEPTAIEARFGLEQPFGSIVAVGEEPDWGDAIAHWRRGGADELRATLRLPAGAYWLELRGDRRSRIARVAPLVVREGEDAAVELDLRSIRTFRVQMRGEDGDDLDLWSRPTSLIVANTCLFFGGIRKERAVSTFGAVPTSARLAGAPGGVDWEVRLVPADLGEGAGPNDLVAIVPRAVQLRAPMEPIVDGRLCGYTYESYEFAPVMDSVVRGREKPRTVSAHPRGGLRVVLRGDRARGVAIEFTRKGGLLVRDWFIATQSGIEFLSQGEGRFVVVTSELDVDVELQLVPDEGYAPDLRPARTRWLPARETCTVWIPEITARLEWLGVGMEQAVLGGIDATSGDRFVVR